MTARKGEAMAWLTAFLAAPGATDDCILWPWYRANGYGMIRPGDGRRTTRGVHVIVCGHFHGPRPPGMEACHSHTGNRHCINPRHLRWGTPSENQADRILHGTDSRGERHGMVKLTGEQVAEIRRAYVPRLPGRHVRPGEGPSMRQLAEKYGVSQQTISDIVNGKNWCAT